jgi:hypothetical protein
MALGFNTLLEIKPALKLLPTERSFIERLYDERGSAARHRLMRVMKKKIPSKTTLSVVPR